MSVATSVRSPQVVPSGPPGRASLVLDQIGYAARELWRSRVVLIFTFVLPLVWLVLIGIIAGNAVLDSASGLRVMQFVTPTAAVMGILFATFPPVAYSLALAREQKILKRLGGTPLPAWAYLCGRTGAAVLLGLASVAVMLAVGVLAYDVQIVWRTLPAAAVTVVVGIVSFAMLGLAVGALAPSASVAQTVALGSAVAVTFLSGLFMIGSTAPPLLDAIASLFPVEHLATALQEQFDPFHPGSGWDLEALAIMGAWGIAGLVVAAWALRREPASASRGPSRRAGANEARAIGPAQPAGERRFGMVLDQAAWATRGSWRDAGVVFFAVAMPVGLYALMATMYGETDLRPDGRPFSFFFACGMAVYGIAVTAFVNNPEFVATARDRAVLKRLRGTPLAPWQYLAGRTGSVIWIGALTAALVFAVGIAFFGVRLGGIDALIAGAAVLVFGILTLAACGYALVAVAPSERAVTAIGLAVLLPLAFFSDIFIIGGAPDWMATVGSLFPLRHFVHALAAALDPAGMSVQWMDLAAMAVWLVGTTLVAVRWFRWDPRR